MNRGLEELIAGHVRRNVVLAEKLSGHGVDLNAPRSVDLHFWAAGEASALDLARALEELGFAVTALGPADDLAAFNVEASKSLSPIEVMDAGFVRHMATMADSRGAKFDGWGTQV